MGPFLEGQLNLALGWNRAQAEAKLYNQRPTNHLDNSHIFLCTNLKQQQNEEKTNGVSLNIASKDQIIMLKQCIKTKVYIVYIH